MPRLMGESGYKAQHPELWHPDCVEGVDYEVRGVYRFLDPDTGKGMVQLDRFPITPKTKQ